MPHPPKGIAQAVATMCLLQLACGEQDVVSNVTLLKSVSPVQLRRAMQPKLRIRHTNGPLSRGDTSTPSWDPHLTGQLPACRQGERKHAPSATEERVYIREDDLHLVVFTQLKCHCDLQTVQENTGGDVPTRQAR